MISILSRAKHNYQQNKKSYCLCVVIQALIFCLLVQTFWAFSLFDQWQEEPNNDEVTLFLRHDIDKLSEEQLISKILRSEQGLSVEKLNATKFLQGQLKNLMDSKETIPVVYSLLYPRNLEVKFIEKSIKKIKKYSGIITVAADMPWIEKRRALVKSINRCKLVLIVPLFTLALLSTWSVVVHVHSFFRDEEAVLKMLGAQGRIVWGPAFFAILLTTVFSILVGSLVSVVGLFLSIPALCDVWSSDLLFDFYRYGESVAIIALSLLLPTLVFFMFESEQTVPKIF